MIGWDQTYLSRSHLKGVEVTHTHIYMPIKFCRLLVLSRIVGSLFLHLEVHPVNIRVLTTVLVKMSCTKHHCLLQAVVGAILEGIERQKSGSCDVQSIIQSLPNPDVVLSIWQEILQPVYSQLNVGKHILLHFCRQYA